MDSPTQAQIERARRIAAHALCGPEKWKPGVKAGMYCDIMRGDADTEALVQGPLIALTEAADRIASLEAGLQIAREEISSLGGDPDDIELALIRINRALLSRGDGNG